MIMVKKANFIILTVILLIIFSCNNTHDNNNHYSSSNDVIVVNTDNQNQQETIEPSTADKMVKAIKNIKSNLDNKASSIKLSKNLSEIREKQINNIIPKLESMDLNDVLFFEQVYTCLDINKHIDLLKYMQSNPNYKNEIQRYEYGNNIEYDIGEFSRFFNSKHKMQEFGKKAY